MGRQNHKKGRMKPAEGDCEMERCTKGEEELTAIEQIGATYDREKIKKKTHKKRYGLGWLPANSMNCICFFH